MYILSNYGLELIQFSITEIRPPYLEAQAADRANAITLAIAKVKLEEQLALAEAAAQAAEGEKIVQRIIAEENIEAALREREKREAATKLPVDPNKLDK